MSTVKLFSQDLRTKGKLMTLPVIGDTQFSSEDNSIEVEGSKLEALLSRDFGIVLMSEEQLQAQEKARKEASKLEDPKKETVKMLRALNESELKELTESYPEEETIKLKTKSSLIDYLCNKMLNK
jgi:hypothetical protein